MSVRLLGLVEFFSDRCVSSSLGKIWGKNLIFCLLDHGNPVSVLSLVFRSFCLTMSGLKFDLYLTVTTVRLLALCFPRRADNGTGQWSVKPHTLHCFLRILFWVFPVFIERLKFYLSNAKIRICACCYSAGEGIVNREGYSNSYQGSWILHWNSLGTRTASQSKVLHFKHAHQSSSSEITSDIQLAWNVL